MSYNLKIVEYADGTAQIKTYDGIVRSHRKKSKPLHKLEQPEKTIVIQATIEELVEMSKNVELGKKQKEEYSLRSSVSRTRMKIEQLSRSGEFSHFVTLTYSPEKVDRYDYTECIKKFTVWLQNVKRKAPDLQALFVPEFHTKNAKLDNEGKEVYAVHFHGLIGHIQGLTLDFYKMRVGTAVYKLKDWNFGISDVTEIENSVAICRYMRKYITKQSISIARTHKNRHRYFKTGLTPPKETTVLIDGSRKEELTAAYIKRYSKKSSKEICREMSDYSEYGYIPVKYVDLKPKM